MAGFLEKDVRDATGPDGRRADAGAANFHARVAANVLRIVERELRDTTADEVTDALGALGFTDEMELAKATAAACSTAAAPSCCPSCGPSYGTDSTSPTPAMPSDCGAERWVAFASTTRQEGSQ